MVTQAAERFLASLTSKDLTRDSCITKACVRCNEANDASAAAHYDDNPSLLKEHETVEAMAECMLKCSFKSVDSTPHVRPHSHAPIISADSTVVKNHSLGQGTRLEVQPDIPAWSTDARKVHGRR